jgi:hypothetical protein
MIGVGSSFSLMLLWKIVSRLSKNQRCENEKFIGREKGNSTD